MSPRSFISRIAASARPSGAFIRCASVTSATTTLWSPNSSTCLTRHSTAAMATSRIAQPFAPALNPKPLILTFAAAECPSIRSGEARLGIFSAQPFPWLASLISNSIPVRRNFEVALLSFDGPSDLIDYSPQLAGKRIPHRW